MITEYMLGDGEDAIKVAIVRSKRKSLGLEVNIYGEVKARVPNRISDRTICVFLEENEGWIRRKTAIVQEGSPDQTQIILRPKELPLKMRREFREKLCGKVERYAQSMGVTYGRITLRFQKSRWGSCSSEGNLSFNYAMALIPEELVDYVVVHELAHRKHMNHSAAFWAEVERHLSGYKDFRQKLRRYRIDVS
ncbi:MAG: SprT family zinc-dependent metalloprotease [Eubacteriales bacterium]|nr:SprT family zinc-dependent metalloprotease [Eubacteriales bacterium]